MSPRKKTARPQSSEKRAAEKPPVRTRKTAIDESGTIRREIICIVLIAFGLLVIISLFAEGATGALGDFIRGILIGFFGLFAYLFPFILIGGSVYAFLSKDNGPRTLRLFLLAAIFFLLLSFVHALSADPNAAYDGFFDYIGKSYKGGSVYNGGLFGAIIGNLFIGLIGKVGTYLFTIVSVLVLLMFLTGRSFFDAVLNAYDRVRDGINMHEQGSLADDEFDDDEPVIKIPRAVNRSTPVRRTKSSMEEILQSSGRLKKAKTFVISERDRSKKVFYDEGEGVENVLTHPVMSETPIKINGVIDEDEAAKANDSILSLYNNFGRRVNNAADEEEETEEKIYDDVYYEELDFENAEDYSEIYNVSKRRNEEVYNNDNDDYYDEEYFEFDSEDEIDDEDFDEYETDDVDSINNTINNSIEKYLNIKKESQLPSFIDAKVPKNEESVISFRQMRVPQERVQTIEPQKPSSLKISEYRASGVISPAPVTPSKSYESLIQNKPYIGYIKPPIDLLVKSPSTHNVGSRAIILENSRKLEETLKSFGVEAKVVEVSQGPTVTRYELAPGQGVKVSKISSLADDLALNLAAVGIRIEAPVPGKSVVGIEIPNKEVTPVFLREVLDDDAFRAFPSKLAVALGKDIAGNAVIADIARMPHLLIAGATGSGKSVCVNTIVISILYNSSPDEIKLLMIDPKVVELSIYNGIPHLLIPVVTDPKKASGALNWAVQEMVTRYKLFAESSVRDLKGYNAMLKESGEAQTLPQIVIIIDELADLMMVAPGEVEDSICRLAQMARAAGIYLIIATQRPSVDVITGLIKANIPSRLAFAVSSGVDSRTVLDMTGAEKLLGKGDMLFCPVGLSKPLRVQGAFISDKEVESVVSFLKVGSDNVYDQEMIDKITAPKSFGEASDDTDELFEEAVEFVIKKEKASASMLQRQFRIGYNRAARLIEEMEARGVVGPEDGSKPRKVLMNSYYGDDD